MPQRAFNLAVAVVGVLVLAAMIVVGVDWSRAARTGPAWRRRLICAALWLLAAIGLSPAAPSSAVAQDTTAPASAPATSDLSKTKEWQSVIDAYAKIAPLTEAEHSTLVQRRAANAAVKAATAAMDHLRLRKQLDSTEVAIIRDDFARLQQLMNRTRPTDMNVTCYLVPVVKPAALSTARITARAELAATLVKSGKIKPEIAAKVIVAFEADLKMYDNQEFMKALTPQQKEEAKKASQQAKDAIESVEKVAGIPTSAPASQPTTPEPTTQPADNAK